MDLQASFPFFSRFPREIKAKIWTIVLEETLPTAYFLGIEEIKDPREEDSGPELDHSKIIFKRLCPTHEYPSTLPPWNDIDTLLHTCRESRAAVTRYRKRHQHTHLLELAVSRTQYTGPNNVLMSPTQYNPTTEGFPGVILDASSDLVILDGYWSRMVLRHSHRYGFLRQAAVQYVAIPFNRPSSSYLDYVNELINAFPDILVLYVVVEPAQLETVKGTWRYGTSSSFLGLRAFAEENYQVGEGEKFTLSLGPKRFHCFGREYFEISPLQLTSLGGLLPLLYDLVMALDTLDLFRIRVMTWRNEE